MRPVLIVPTKNHNKTMHSCFLILLLRHKLHIWQHDANFPSHIYVTSTFPDIKISKTFHRNAASQPLITKIFCLNKVFFSNLIFKTAPLSPAKFRTVERTGPLELKFPHSSEKSPFPSVPWRCKLTTMRWPRPCEQIPKERWPLPHPVHMVSHEEYFHATPHIFHNVSD